MTAPLKYVKLASGEELLTMYMEPDGGFFKFKHPVKISHVVDQEGDEGVRCRFISIIFPFEATTIEVKIVYAKDDRYGSTIEEKILASLEIIKELFCIFEI